MGQNIHLQECPLCGININNINYTHKINVGNAYTNIICGIYHKEINISNDIFDKNDAEKLFDLALEHVLKYPYQSNTYFYYDKDTRQEEYDEDHLINLYTRLNMYPQTLSDKAERGLINISKLFPVYGQEIMTSEWLSHAVFCERDIIAFRGMMKMLDALSYINLSKNGYAMTITPEGWKKVEQLSMELDQGFIAMSFSDETKLIREAFREAISNAGYSPVVIDEKEHNGQIVPEIFFEIKRSKFVVVDVTYPNYGAYYEAGYAQALDKEVIICCNKKQFNNINNRPHFDIAQKSMIIWETEEQLVQMLKRRIEATVN